MNAKSRAHFPSSEPDRDPPCWAQQCPDSQLHCRRFGQNIESSCCRHPRRPLVNDLPPPKRPGNLQQWLVQHLHWQQQQQSNIDTEQCLIYFALFDLLGNLACWLFAKVADIEAKQFTTGDRHWFVCGVHQPHTSIGFGDANLKLVAARWHTLSPKPVRKSREYMKITIKKQWPCFKK